ncbi:MAG: hypothetical protein AAF567_05450 [Actinomycetota bacterium]
MGALFGSMAAFAIGMSELFGRKVVARSGPVTAGIALQIVSVLATIPVALLVGGSWVWADMWFGTISGLFMAGGLGFYFQALVHSSSTVVAPTSATLSAILPFGYALLRGAEASGLAVVGALIAFVGLAVIAAGTAEITDLREGLLWGGLSGLGYGIGLAIYFEVGEESGVWAALTQRGASTLALVVVALIIGARVVPAPGTVRDSAAAGSFAAFTSIAVLVGLRIDAPSTIVTWSMFPMVSVIVGYLLFSDAVARRQVFGIGLALGGIACVVGA